MSMVLRPWRPKPIIVGSGSTKVFNLEPQKGKSCSTGKSKSHRSAILRKNKTCQWMLEIRVINSWNYWMWNRYLEKHMTWTCCFLDPLRESIWHKRTLNIFIHPKESLPPGNEMIFKLLGLTSNSLRSHFDSTSISLRTHFGRTSVSLRFHFNLTSVSLKDPRETQGKRKPGAPQHQGNQRNS